MTQSRTSLASAAWADRRTIEQQMSLRPGDFWLGRSDTDDAIPLGYADDRHVCLTSSTRGGKGTSMILNNLCGWPGSVVVVDPKGENATITAARRGAGSARATGLGQKVYVLDPFNTADVPAQYRATFNPLDALDPSSESMTIAAGEIANAIVVQPAEGKDKFFDESGRALLKALILHVRTSVWFDDAERNLLTVRRLLMRGAWRDVEELREQQRLLPEKERKKIPSAHLLLWKQVKQNDACDGIIRDAGELYGDLLRDAPETYQGVLQSARTNTDFIEDVAMSRLLASSTPGFSLSQLKADPKGISIYLSLPDEHMDTHSRWLRLMIGLTISECRKLGYQPKSGHRVLVVLDEFAGLQRMPAIENAVAKMAGYGLKMFFVLQTLEQLKSVYPDRWETFLANCGIKIFFSLGDQFSREHVSKLMGETEIVRITRSITLTHGETLSVGETVTVGRSLSTSRNVGLSQTRQRGWTNSDGETISTGRQGGTNRSTSIGISGGESTHWGQSTGVSSTESSGSSYTSGPNGGSFGSNSGKSTTVQSSSTSGGGRHTGWSQQTSDGVSEGWSDGVSRSLTGGVSGGDSEAVSSGSGDTDGISYSHARNMSHSVSDSVAMGATETLHVRPLLQPYEINVLLRRVDDDRPSSASHPDYANAAYPGLALILIEGENACLVRRANYYEDPCFVRYFDKHPDHDWKEPRQVDVLLHGWRRRFHLREEPMKVEWLIAANDRVLRGQTVAYLSADTREKLPRLPIFAVNDGVVSGMSCPDGEYGRGQVIAYQLLTSKRTPRPDIRETDWTQAADLAAEKRRRMIMAALIGAAVVAVALVIIAEQDPEGFATFLHVLLWIAGIAGLGVLVWIGFQVPEWWEDFRIHVKTSVQIWWEDHIPAWFRELFD